MGAWGSFFPSRGRQLCGPAFLTGYCLGRAWAWACWSPPRPRPPLARLALRLDLGVGKELLF